MNPLSSASPPDPASETPAALDVFLGFLSRRAAGGEQEIDGLCERLPDVAVELRRLWSDWQNAPEASPAVPPGATLSDRLHERFGVEIDPGVSLESEPPSVTGATPAGLLTLLAGRAPKGTRYKPEGEIARGGMGAILKVWDSELRRHLAMKVALEDRRAPRGAVAPPTDPAALERFMEEAQVTGQLEHPGIVPVHELGLDAEGRLYFTMRLVRGQDLKRVFELAWEGRDGWTQFRVVGVLLKVCEALAYAHAKGVLHRDLKPANIMVGSFGEVYVMDWGVARVLAQRDRHDLRLAEEERPVSTVRTPQAEDDGPGEEESALRTRDGDVVGTPAYMSPEQARGELDRLSVRSDVYSVGAMLYHLLARSMPYAIPGQRVRPSAILARVLAGPPPSIGELNTEVPQELAAICDKAMAREPQARYASTRDMAEDLQAYLEGRVVRAYETGAVAELRKWVKRNRGLASTGVAAVLAIIFALGGITYTEAKGRTAVEAKNVVITWEKQRADVSADLAKQEAEKARQEALTSERVVDFLSGMFQKADPWNVSGELLTAKDLVDGATKRIEAELGGEPLVRARLSHVLGNAYRALGSFAEAGPLLQTSLELRRNHLGPDHADTLATLQDVAFLHRSWGHLDQAATLYGEAIDGWRRLRGEDSRECLRAQSGLADLYFSHGRQDQAEPLCTDVLERQARLFGEADPDTLLTMGVQIGLHFGRQRFEEAEKLLKRILVILRREGREAELDRPLSMLGGVFYYQHRLAEAEPLFEEVLELRRRTRGANDLQTLLALNNLAGCRLAQGKLEAAEALYDELLEVQTRTLSEFHADRIITLWSIAELRVRQGRFEEAERMYTQILAGIRDQVPPENPSLLGTQGALARLYGKLERFEEAEPLIRGVLERTPPDHPKYQERRELFEAILKGLAREPEASRAHRDQREK